MARITWNTDVNAPGCPGEIVNDDGRTLLIQTDWDYPGTANTFGWATRMVQKCPQCGHVATDVEYDAVTFDCVECEHEEAHPGERWPITHPCCDHASDGTVDCKCGVKAGDFISAAADWLADNDGAETDDPGYFAE